jgi:tetratricopeptide (TPR) repeat protein
LETGAGTRTALALALALACAALAHAPALDVGFVRDDHLLVEANPLVQEPRPLPEYFARAFWSVPTGPGVERYWRPLTLLSFALDWRVSGGVPRRFHATNLALHLACTALVFALARRAGASAAAAGLAAAAFGAFPRGSEAVAWVSGRTDVLATLGALAALLLYTTEPRAHARRALAACAFLAGLLAKEVAVAALAGVALLEWRARTPRGLADSAPRLFPLAIAAALYAVLRSRAEPASAVVDWLHPLERPLFALQALGAYVAMLADPLRPRLVIGRLGVIEPALLVLGALGLGALGGLVAHRWRSPPPPPGAALAAVGLAALVPVLHLVPLPLSVVAADRFLYLPVAALSALLAAESSRLDARSRGIAAVACAVAVVAFVAATRARERDWQDELRLFEIEAARAPHTSPDAHAELATLLAWQGRSDEALALYQEALRRDAAFTAAHPGAPRDRTLRANYALALSEVGRTAGAVAILEAVTREDPGVGRYWLWLGAVRARALDLDGAERALARASELSPDLALAAQLRAQVGRAREVLRGLPPERAGEDLGARVARARAYTLLGRLGDADRLWREIAEAPEVSAADLVRATRHLVHRGRDLAAAERAVARLEQAFGASDEVRALAAALAARRPPTTS